MRVGQLDGITQNGEELTTISGSQATKDKFLFISYYLPASGVVTSVNQDVADTNAVYKSNGTAHLSAANWWLAKA